jgi:hypothetical protein
MRTIRTLATVALLVALGVHADTRECRDVDSLAVVTAFDTVTWRGDKAAKTCRFTVGLAPPPSASAQGIKRLDDLRERLADPARRKAIFSDGSRGFDAVAGLLGAASENGSLPDAAWPRLKSAPVQQTLNGCFEAVRKQTEVSRESEGNVFACKVAAAPYRQTKALYFSALLRLGEGPSEQSFGASIPLP